MIRAQDGDCSADRPRAAYSQVTSDVAGLVSSVDTEQLGQAIISMGGGRKVASDQIDPSVGLEMLVRIGDLVDSGQPLMNLFAHDNDRDEVTVSLRKAVTVSTESVTAPPLIVDSI